MEAMALQLRAYSAIEEKTRRGVDAPGERTFYQDLLRNSREENDIRQDGVDDENVDYDDKPDHYDSSDWPRARAS